MTTNIGGVEMDVSWNVPRMSKDLTSAATTAADHAGAQAARVLEDRFASFGTKASKVGRDMTLGFSAPFVAGAVVTTKAFSSYEASLSKITGLVGVSQEQIQAWDGDIKRIGVDFGVGAQDAADAMYFITSSGLEGADALGALEESAKASAAGLGDTQTIADLVTSAMNAYGPSVLSAANATDILTVAVRDGKSDPDELAGAMSRVLPVASAMGVSFDQVAGVMASMSLSGTDASTAATQLRGILGALLKPSKQAESALNGVGLSSAGLRKQIAEQGLLPTLENLVATLGNDSAATAQVFDDVRALTGVMDILGAKTDGTRKILDDTAASAGATDKAFEAASNTTDFKLKQSMADIQKDLINIGSTVAPLAETVASGASKITDAFSAMPAPIKSVALGLGAVVAVAGPTVWAIGKVSSGISSAIKLAERFATSKLDKAVSTIGMTSETAAAQNNKLTSSLSKIASGGAAAGIAITGALTALNMWNDAREESIKLAQKTGSDIFGKVQGGGIDDARRQVDEINQQIGGLQDELAHTHNPLDIDYIQSLQDMGTALQDNGAKAVTMINRSVDLGKATGTSADQAFRWIGAQEKAGKTFGSTEEALKAYQDELAKNGGLTDEAKSNADQIATKFKELQTSFFGSADAVKSYEDATRGVEEAHRKVAQSSQAVADAQHSYEDALHRIDAAEDRRVESLRDIVSAQKDVVSAQRTLDEALNGEKDALSVDEAKIRLERARKALSTGKFDSPLDRRQAQIDVRRAELDLQDTEYEASQRVTTARDGLADAEHRLANAHQSADDAARGVTDAQRGLAAAGRAVQDAQHDAAEASREVGTAQDEAAKAAVAMAAAEGELRDTVAGHSDQVVPLLAQLEELKTKYPELAAAMQPYIDQLAKLDPSNGGLMNYFERARSRTAGGAIDNGIRAVQGAGRANGGSVWAGWSHPVNERKVPELFNDSAGHQFLIPLADGQVDPLQPAGGGGSPLVGQLVLHAGGSDVAPVLFEAHSELRRLQLEMDR